MMYVSRRKLLNAARRMSLDITITPISDGIHYDILAPDGKHFDDCGLHAIQWYEYDWDKAEWKAAGYAEELQRLGTLIDCEPDCDCGFGKEAAA